MKLRKSTKSLIRKIFQTSYILLFIFISVGIAGNMDLDEPTPTWAWITLFITGFLTVGKIIYVSLKENLRDQRG